MAKMNGKSCHKMDLDEETIAEKNYFGDENIIMIVGNDKQRNGVAAVSVVVKCENGGIEVKEEAIICSREGALAKDECHNCMRGGSEAITGKHFNVNIVRSNYDANIFANI